MVGWSREARPIENRSRPYPAAPRREGPRRICLAGAATVVIVVAGCGGSGGESSAGPTIQAKSVAGVCKAGAREGQVAVTKATEPEDFAKEIGPFKAKYPGIKVKYQSMRPEDSVQRLFAARQARRTPDADAVDMDLPSVYPLMQQGMIQRVDWKSMGMSSGEVLTAGHDVQLPRSERIVLGLGYNTNKVTAAELPNTWDGLVNSRWAGKVIVDPRGKYLSGLALAWGQDRAVNWFKRFLAVDKPQQVEGATTSVEKVISGEALLTTSSHDAEIREQQAKGAPVKIKYLDVVPTQEHYGAIPKGAAHPNAAACFLAWWSSPDGGGAVQQKVEFKTNESKPAGIPANAKLAVVTDPAQVKTQSDVGDKFAELMGNK